MQHVIGLIFAGTSFWNTYKLQKNLRRRKGVEIDESKFDKRKYNRGRNVKGQWVFGGVERGSGKTFLAAVHDRTNSRKVSGSN